MYSETLFDVLGRLKEYPSVFVVCDRAVARGIARPLVEEAAAQGVAIRGMLSLRISERRKNLRSVARISRFLMRAGADRDALVLGIGGGITTDLVGFAACCYKRGVRFAFIPTTLLAQVDAATGGKTACNLDGYKNMLGIIREPEFTFICPALIRTQSWKDFSCGYAEMLKTFIIADPDSYHRAVALGGVFASETGDVSNESFALLGELIRRCVEIKSDIVSRDPEDRGERRTLNLGHTFAHAIECRSSKSLFHKMIPHGHAVAMGIILSAQLSEARGVAGKGLAEQLKKDFRLVGLPVESPWSEEQLKGIMSTDKKARDGHIDYVLIRAIGSVEIKSI